MTRSECSRAGRPRTSKKTVFHRWPRRRETNPEIARRRARRAAAAAAQAADHEITDNSRSFTVLVFLSLLPAAADQHAVLRRRLEFLEEPVSFFYQGERPLRAEEVADPYRRGMLLVARATSHAERGWLHQVLNDAAPDAARGTRLPDMPHARGEPGG